jgi:sulfur-carrier protein
MTITLKLFASLTPYLPPDARAAQQAPLEIPAGSTVLDAIRRMGIPEAACAIVLLDGAWVARPDRASMELADGQALAIWPPVAGG